MAKRQHVILHGGKHEKARADVSYFDPIQLAKGTRVELEHTSDKSLARQIAMDHLTEDPRYYDRLGEMEARAKRNKTRLPAYGEVHREQVENGKATIVIRAIRHARKGDCYQARVLLGTGEPSSSGKEPLLWHDAFYVDSNYASQDDALNTAIAMAKAWARSPEGKRRIATSKAVVGKSDHKVKVKRKETAMSNPAGMFHKNPIQYYDDEELDRLFSDPEFRASVPEGHWTDVKILFSVLLANGASHIASTLERMMKSGDISQFFVDDRVLNGFRRVNTRYTAQPAGKREFVFALESLKAAMKSPKVNENPVKSVVDEHAATELKLYAEGEPSIYPQRQSIENSLMLKMWNGTYDHSKAQKLWLYWIDAAARKYVDEHGAKGERIDSFFTTATRQRVAKEFADEVRHELKQRIESGEKPKIGGKPIKKSRKVKENPVKTKTRSKRPSFVCPAKSPVKKGTLRSVVRRKLPPELFALPEARALPIHDKGHAKAAIGRLNMMWNRKSITAEQYREAFKNIAAAFECFGLELHTKPKVPLEGSAKPGMGKAGPKARKRAVKATDKTAPEKPKKVGSRSRVSTLADPKLKSKLIAIEGNEWAENENGSLPTSLTLHIEGWKILHAMNLVGSASLKDLNPKLGLIHGAGRTRYRVDPKTGEVNLVMKSATAEKIAAAKRLGVKVA